MQSELENFTSADSFGDLVLRAASDSSAAAELVSVLLPSIRSMARALDPKISEDLLQEGLLGALAAIGDFDSGRGDAKAFLLTCAKNKMLSSIKRNSPIGGCGEESEELPEFTEAEAAERERFEQLNSAMRSVLTKRERNVVELYISGLSYREIADVLGADRKSVDNAMQRARKKLRAELEGQAHKQS